MNTNTNTSADKSPAASCSRSSDEIEDPDGVDRKVRFENSSIDLRKGFNAEYF